MKFVLAFTGSRGDVQPGLSLGVELRARGHDVTMAVPPNLTEFCRRAAMPTREFGTDTKELLDSALVSNRLKSANPLTRLRAIAEITLRDGRTVQSDLMDLTAGADAVIGGNVGQERLLNVATARGIPYIPVHYCPLRRNGVVSLLPWERVPGHAHRLSWAVLEQLTWLATRSAERELAADLGLAPPSGPPAGRIVGHGMPEIQAYDPVIFPGLAREWRHRKPLVGFLDLAPHTRTAVGDADDSATLDDWLTTGSPPLYVGFGSMSIAEPERLARTFIEVAAELGLRLLVATGWSEFMASTTGDTVRAVRTVDHAAVLPRCVAAVHHGGAGSTAAALRAGIPALACWLGADQPMWGRRLHALGVGTALAAARVDRDSLTRALHPLLTPEYATAAQALGSAMVTPAAAVHAAATLIEDSVRTPVGTGTSRGGIL
ncbi:glycosyltransferase [Nocardia salmonicida]|uniref:glycosyltransferase n=1 Tax=Nocardia salmonicida TaxID=53431 RepID=UPI0007A49455|nr:glycosyltransferase [Nocardia salmonicida]